VKIDSCQGGCMLYYKDDSELTKYKFCGLPRYMPGKGQNKRYEKVSIKRIFYLTIIPRLQRLYASMDSARQMRRHHENKRDDGLLRHPSDGKAWKHFDNVYPDFAAKPRHIRLGLCSDGFTQYVQASASPYSCWPKFLTPYMFLTCLIPV